ncbi:MULTISPECIES: DUF4177 domain-containing protein [Psychrobacter]|uniref:DUF4177 domain-containing protein n=1 Tax=Psychrobacter TaxID=497 RepID=UPI00146D9ACA|nr:MULTISPECIES: DUF4177 domain-containing protein [Psychrobacter]
MNYEYQFIKIEFKRLTGEPRENYQDIIIEQAKQGWRFVQIFSPDFVTSGVAVGSYFELIFERSSQQ